MMSHFTMLKLLTHSSYMRIAHKGFCPLGRYFITATTVKSVTVTYYFILKAMSNVLYYIKIIC